MTRASAIFCVTTAGFTLSMFYRVSATVISPQLSQELGLTTLDLSNLSAAFFYAFALAQIPLGPALDRIGPRKVMTVLGTVGVAGALLFATAQTGLQAFVGRLLLGLGMAGNLMGALSLLVAWFPPNKFATLMGVLTSIGTVGMMLASSPLALMAQSVGWRATFMIIAIINALQAIALFLIVRDHPPGYTKSTAPKNNHSLLQSFKPLFTMPSFWFISMATFFRFGCYLALQALWAGPFLIYGLGYDAVRAGNMVLLCSLGYTVGLPFGGRLSDHVLRTRKYVALPFLFLFSLLFALMPLLNLWNSQPPAGIYYVLFFLIGFVAAPSQVVYAHIKELCPKEMAATSLTGINFFNMLGPAAVMQLAAFFLPGEISDITSAHQFSPVWFLFAGVLFISGVGYCFTKESNIIRS